MSVELPFSEAVEINPPVVTKRGEIYPFVDMASVDPSSRSVAPVALRAFKGGGSRFLAGDTLMARITPCLENGKIARYVPDSAHASVSAHGSTEFYVIRGKEGVTDNEFAYYLTQSDGVRNRAIDQMSGTSGRQRVPIDAFDHIIVSLPPLSEQRAIAHILGTLDDKIELNRKMNQILEEMARALFKSWFVDFDPVRAKLDGRWRPGESLPGLPADLYHLFPDRLVPSQLGEIPEGWGVKALDEMARFVNGLALQKYPPIGDRTLPVVKIAQLRTGDTKGADQASADLEPDYVVSDGDILFSWSGSLECVVWAGGPGALNQHLFKVIPKDLPRWLCYTSVHHHLPEFRQVAAGKATTMGHIQRHHLSDALLAVPGHELIDAMSAVLEPVFERTWRRDLESRALAAQRDALLPKLVSGEVRAGA